MSECQETRTVRTQEAVIKAHLWEAVTQAGNQGRCLHRSTKISQTDFTPTLRQITLGEHHARSGSYFVRKTLTSPYEMELVSLSQRHVWGLTEALLKVR